jgi:hypothetical protein
MRLLFFFCITWPFLLQSQVKHDYVWLNGFQTYGGTSENFGVIMMDFNQDTIDISRVPRQDHKIYFYQGCMAFMSNPEGELQFYSDGCRVYDATHDIMMNGDTLNPGIFWDENCAVGQIGGYTSGRQTMLALPWPGSESEYLLLHLGIDYFTEQDSMQFVGLGTPFLYYTHIDMEGNDGLGEVIQKNVPLVGLDISFYPLISAVKHANGQDWWILISRRESSEYFKILVTPSGIIDTFSQHIGYPFITKGMGGGREVFSPDGTRYARHTFTDGLTLMDFDRSTGLFSNFQHFWGDSISPWRLTSIAFSPSGRFLYINDWFELWQYDMEAPDFEASGVLIAEYDGFEHNNFWPTGLNQTQLGPDCRIYMSTNSTTPYVHVIDKPDLKGLDCDFRQRGLKMPTVQSHGMPYFPNYRLDSLPSYPCDSNIVLTYYDPTTFVYEVLAAQPGTLQPPYPNPADTEVWVNLPAAEGTLQLMVANAQGQLQWQQSVQGSEQPQPVRVATADWAPGVYYILLQLPNGQRMQQRVSIVH